MRSMLVGGEFDHPLTCVSLNELGKIALEAGEMGEDPLVELALGADAVHRLQLAARLVGEIAQVRASHLANCDDVGLSGGQCILDFDGPATSLLCLGQLLGCPTQTPQIVGGLR